MRAAAKPCPECPWRKDVPVGRFPPERFESLVSTVKQDFGPIFACHKSREGQEIACAGYIARDGTENFRVRLAAIHGQIDVAAIRAEAEKVPLFDSYREMAAANGVFDMIDGQQAEPWSEEDEPAQEKACPARQKKPTKRCKVPRVAKRSATKGT